MRIALTHLRHAHAGGTERYCNSLATQLADEGHDVTIVCRTHEDHADARIQFVTLRQTAFGRGHRLWRFARAVDQHVQQAGYDVVYGLGRTWSQDIIRLGGGTWAKYLEHASQVDRPKWQRLLGRDLLTDRITLGIERRALGPIATGGTPAIVCNSNLIATEVAQRYGVDQQRLHVIHNAVDCHKFDRHRYQAQASQLRQEWGCTENDTLLLFLGSNYSRKGLDRTLTAYRNCDVTNTKLVVVGYDKNIAHWQFDVRQRGLADHVVFAGGRRDAPICYAAADCYILPTRYDPFANTTLEALANELPVITTTGNGGSEIIDDSVGAVVPWQPSEQEPELSTALQRWLSPTAIDSARAACRQRAQENNAAVELQKSLTVIQQAIEAKHSA